MSDKNKIQPNINNLVRERFSNFVVDLRTVERVKEPGIKKESRRRPFNFKSLFIFKRAKLLEKKRQFTFNDLFKSIRFWPRRRSVRQNFWQRLRDSFRPRPKPRHFWQKAIRERTRIFSAIPRHQRRKKYFGYRNGDNGDVEYRPLISFVIVLFLIIALIKILSFFPFLNPKSLEAKITGQVQLALNSLSAAADSASKLRFKEANSNFKTASANFLAAQDDLNEISSSILSLASLSPDPKLKLAAESKKFLAAGAIASSLGSNLVLATDSLFSGVETDFKTTLDNFLVHGQAAANDAQELKKTVAAVNPNNLPEAYRLQFESLNKQAGLLADNLTNFVTLAGQLKEVLGLSRDKRYLLVFQNNAELRASGGFLGSYALVDLRDGKIRNLEVPGGGSYDTEAGMKNIRVAAPQPLWLVNPLWHFWDANWWPNWPTTAKNLMWFYAKSDGPSVDGVISVTPTVVEQLLEITGPIDLTAEYGLVISADNFWEATQTIVERKDSPDNKPKKIIGDLMAKILEILPRKLNKDNLLKIMVAVEENLSSKQILFYFQDPKLEAAVASRNWAGEIKDTDKDYLLVVNTNIAGQKSDRVMSERIEQRSEVGIDGTIINTVKIFRTHNGVKNEPLTGVRNVNWLRVYVPQGSELLNTDGWYIPAAEYFSEKPEANWETSPLLVEEKTAGVDPASGTKVYLENNKTVFANWVMVDPGETAIITLRYRLPFNFYVAPKDTSWLKQINNWLNPEETALLPYSLLVQKQPGAVASEFSSQLSLPAGLNILWRYPENLSGVNGWEINDRLNTDKYWTILTQKNNNK
jgi:hypothetical protein